MFDFYAPVAVFECCWSDLHTSTEHVEPSQHLCCKHLQPWVLCQDHGRLISIFFQLDFCILLRPSEG